MCGVGIDEKEETIRKLEVYIHMLIANCVQGISSIQ